MVAILVLLVVLMSAVPAQAAWQIAGFHETSTLQGAGTDGDRVVTLDPYPPGGYRSATIATMRVGPIDLQAGDILDIRSRHEFTNDNAEALSWWGVPRHPDGLYVQSEHWSLWVMVATYVRVGSVTALAQTEQNFDNYIHHLPVERSGFYRVPASVTGQYVESRVYFKSSQSYTKPGATMRIHGPHSKLQVAVFREEAVV